ncbi:MAG: type II toxin-antitoxin system RelE/ParE family toxin [Deltaproteobacteria bacterium]|nr:type II toxin-antitoxin system RelE/ParE family toxin [Deltaproteobacteria bacterium]MBI4795743.1 type II toxin-antitoxin system RelE/ParE family toxin [Deltaproteobacteria bacterium]
MARYRLLIKPSAVKEIEAVPLIKERRRIIERISKLAENPRPFGCEKLSGQEKYRLRQGRYRILYSISDQDLVVNVVKVGHRKDVYN